MSWTIPTQEEAEEFSRAFLMAKESYVENHFIYEEREKITMWEDTFQVYRRIGESYIDIMASDMTIDNAILFAKAWMQENFNDQESSIEIRRQPMPKNEETGGEVSKT
jgi:hypothetical protein